MRQKRNRREGGERSDGLEATIYPLKRYYPTWKSTINHQVCAPEVGKEADCPRTIDSGTNLVVRGRY